MEVKVSGILNFLFFYYIVDVPLLRFSTLLASFNVFLMTPLTVWPTEFVTKVNLFLAMTNFVISLHQLTYCASATLRRARKLFVNQVSGVSLN